MITNGPIYIPISESTEVTSTVAVGAGLTAYSDAFELVDLNDFSLEYKLAGIGILGVKLQLQQRQSKDVAWCIPDNMADIRPNIVDDDQHICRLGPLPSRYIRIVVIEQAILGVDTVVTLRIIGQRKYPA